MTAPTATSAAKREEQAIQELKDVLQRCSITLKVDNSEATTLQERILSYVQSIFPNAKKEHLPETCGGIRLAMEQGDCRPKCPGRNNCEHNGCIMVLIRDRRRDGRYVIGTAATPCGVIPIKEEDDDGDKSYFRDKKGGQHR